MIRLERIIPSARANMLLLILGLATLAKGQVPASIEACMEETIFVPVYIEQLSEYKDIHMYELKYEFNDEDLHFLGIDSTKTLIPTDGLSINVEPSPQNADLTTIIIATNSNTQALYEINENAVNLITLKFESRRQQDTTHVCSLDIRNNSNNLIDNYSIINRLIVHNNILEIFDFPTLNFYEGLLGFSATRGYESYEWSYRKKYSWNLPYAGLIFDGPDAHFNGHGIYSVTAIDEHGCQLSDERYFQIDAMPGIRFESDQQVVIPDTLSVAVTSMCIYYSCTSEDFTIKSVNFYFEYEPDKLAFDTCLFNNTIFPEGYFKGYTTNETEIDSGFVNLNINLLIDDNQPAFKYTNYEVGDFMKINFIPKIDGETEIGLTYLEINGERAVTATIRKSIEILPGEDIGSYAKGTVWTKNEPYNAGEVIAYLKLSEQYTQAAQTNIDEGIFEFSAILADGEYVFCAFPEENSGFKPTFYGNRETIDSAFVITLKSYDGVVALNIQLLPDAEHGSSRSEADNKSISFHFDLYPNPVHDFLYLDLHAEAGINQNISLLITDISGKPFYSSNNIEEFLNSNETQFKVDTRNYPQGIYVVKAGNVSKLFIKR
jgi:hypothetical protein